MNELEKARNTLSGLWQKIRQHEFDAFPLPDDLTDEECQAVLLQRLCDVPIGTRVSEEEVLALMERARKAKRAWGWFRAAFAGVISLAVEGGELKIKMRDDFAAANAHLFTEGGAK